MWVCVCGCVYIGLRVFAGGSRSGCGGTVDV